MRRLRTVAALVAVGLVCMPGSALGAVHHVGITPNAFDPAELQVDEGDAVQFHNFDTKVHNATPYDASPFFDGTGDLNGGQSSPPQPMTNFGRYEIVCTIHGFSGAVNVSGGSSEHFPVVNADGLLGPRSTTTYALDGPPAAVAPDLVVTDDEPNLDQGRVEIVGDQPGDELGFTDQSGITGAYDRSAGVLMLTGEASVTDYQAALRSITFETSAGTGTREIDFIVRDAGTAQTRGSPDRQGISIVPATSTGGDPDTGGAPGGGGPGSFPTDIPPGGSPGGLLPVDPEPLDVRLRSLVIRVDRNGAFSVRIQVDEPNLDRPIDGDFDLNGVVDAADYAVWRQNLGTAGRTDEQASSDFAVWQANFGATTGGRRAAAALAAGPATVRARGRLTRVARRRLRAAPVRRAPRGRARHRRLAAKLVVRSRGRVVTKRVKLRQRVEKRNRRRG